jgi:TRAP-type C4-dicarboxylate transport system substrate-binding protein
MRAAVAEAVAFQRELHEKEEDAARDAIAAQGCEIVELSAEEHRAFASAVAPLLADAQTTFGDELLALADAPST